ncbi:MAG TPA: tetratricopeptide repeat protein [Syntrophobacteria bacterium]|nr:tetratricopeptide repeat protein [Syntrophobacteria bacterium]
MMYRQTHHLRQIEREKAAAQQARERRAKIVRILKWTLPFGVVAAAVAAVVSGSYFTRYTALWSFLPAPKRLVSVVLSVNGARNTLPAEGTLVVNPADVVAIEEINTDGRFSWGVSLQSAQFPAKQLRDKGHKIGEFWPQYDYAEPIKADVDVWAGAQAIGRFTLMVRLGEKDWLDRAQAAPDVNTRIKYLERAAGLAPQNTEVLVSLAKAYGERGQWTKAAATYETAAALGSTADLLKKLVEANQKAGDIDATLNAYLKLIQANESDKESFYGFVSYINAKKGPKKGAAYLSGKIESLPKSFQPEAHAYLGTLLGQENQWKEAIEAYKRAVAGGYTNPVIDLNLGEAYTRVGNHDAAEQSLQAYLKKKPDDADGKLRLAEVYGERKKYKEAISLVQEVTKANPKDVKAELALVKLYEKAKMDKEAAAAYEQLATLAPNNKVVFYNQGVLSFEQKQYDKAAKAFSQVVKIDAKDTDAREYLIRIYQAQKKPRQAVAVAEELMQLQPTQWANYQRAFDLYDQLKAYDAMTKTFSRAVERAPNQPEPRFYLGLAYEKRGLLAEAIKQFEAASKLSPKNKEYLNHIGLLYERLGKVEAALKAYQAVLDLDPNDTKAEENYLRLKVKRLQQPKTG